MEQSKSSIPYNFRRYLENLKRQEEQEKQNYNDYIKLCKELIKTPQQKLLLKQKYIEKIQGKKFIDNLKKNIDKNYDNYISIDEYLDYKYSLGPYEEKKGLFDKHNQRNLGILFFIYLIKQQGPISHIACIPDFFLCIYKDINGKYYTLKNNTRNFERFTCPEPNDTNTLIYGNFLHTRASIYIINAPYKKDDDSIKNKMQLLIPPNLKEIIEKCISNKKKIVICSLTLINQNKLNSTGHSNVIIFDTHNKIIERFDPHGASSVIVYGEKKSSNAKFNQIYIDSKLQEEFIKILPDYKYLSTENICPYLGPQIKADLYGGLCVTWSTMYMLLRVLNPTLKPLDITKKMIKGTKNDLIDKILKFQKFLIESVKTMNSHNFYDYIYN